VKGVIILAEIPICGRLISNEEKSESGSSHSHYLQITSWDGKPLHTHPFYGVTSFDVGHNHRYAGTTAPAPSGVPHTHKYYTITSFDDGHKHVIKGVTGPAITLPNGGHYHAFRGVTTVNGDTPHAHSYSGRTC
jgi:hypothetical protein